jgi:hypothetical protein
MEVALTTRKDVLEILGCYDPQELAWDDPRSNRKPTAVRNTSKNNDAE